MTGPVSPPQREQHRPIARFLLLLVGLLFVTGGALLLALALWTLLTGSGLKMRALGSLLLALFGAIALYGCVLLRRGLQGWSSVGALDRADASFQRGMAEWLPMLGLAIGTLVWAVSRGRVFAPASLWYLPVSFALFPLSAGIHELGHLLPGLVQGRTLCAIRVWPATFRRSSAGWVRSKAGLRVSDGLAGFVQWSGPAEPGRAADFVMVAGGPVANLAGAALLLFLGRALDGSWPGLAPLLRAAALGNVLLGVQNLIPLRSQPNVLSDGARILRLLGPGHRAFRMRERLLGRALLVRPRDWGVSSQQLTGEAAPDPTDRGWLRLLGLSVATDRDDRAEIERILTVHAEEPVGPPEVLREFCLQAALITALLHEYTIVARAWLTIAPSNEDGYSDLAQAAVLLTERNVTEAQTALTRWKLAALAHPEWIAGNQWAVERLEAVLGPTGQP